MAEPTAKDIERAREWAADGANEFTLTEILAVDHYAQGLADERARNVAWLRDLASRLPHADINPRAFALQVKCIRTAAHLLERGAADELEADHE